MPEVEIKNRSIGTPQSWLTTLSIIFISLFGVILSLITIYALPDQTVRPSIGALFYLCCAVLISIFLLFRWKKEKVFENHFLNEAQGKADVLVKETVSDKLIKWLITIYSILFVFSGVSMSLICIYALPDQTVQPNISLLFYIGGAIVIGSFIFVVWKNWTSKRP